MKNGNNFEDDKERDGKTKMYVIIYNIGKKKNIGNIVRSCVAFNVSEIFVVGRNKKETSFFGSMGTHGYIRIRYFSNMIELKEYLNDNNILLYGCEITNQSIPITKQPFVKNKDTAFLFGNEGTGISDQIIKMCDKIIYIPQYGNGIASLNVSVSCAIILQTFAVWANYIEVDIKGNKFIIQERQNKLNNYLNPSEELIKEINDKRTIREIKKKEIQLANLDNLEFLF
ncbi:RNA methyltransferase [Plasmodium yoelii]|uniref:RNA methyltransferase n=3 Tax=Plasmodium yoelii TaxID=5861 RepID=A0AAF0B360_PLAYO|nr:RNA methyltransferase [Plasmodium yoelii]EAA16666.1 RNA methyltransferase, TrmH family, putative [Plasmodium yoelii yoelii]WBY55679.1 RNA methyltransferase [Plasmodium yoelii yoelii]CDU16746.1 RNA methyltransferase, putative [Plasmodium yoelii]VTZ74318.1 RNA methyltransferase, putative [Plasmodium yoelii]|eukprot:XP_725101.1 RNA methyltransferase [Plasmodium yoelii]